MHKERAHIDCITVAERLERAQLAQLGGLAWLLGLTERVVVTTNVPAYAQLVHEKAVLRSVWEAAGAVRESIQVGGEFRQLRDEAEKRILQATRAAERSLCQGADTLTECVLTQLAQARTGQLGQALSTGIYGLDKLLLGGLRRTDLVVLAARPAMGKSALALNIAHQIAAKQQIPVGIFSLEMKADQLMQRLLAGEALVDLNYIRSGHVTDAQWDLCVQAGERLYGCPIYIDDSPGLQLAELRARARRMKAEKGIGLLVVDYLQLLMPEDRRASREQQVSEISRGLKQLAKELDLPVLALSQLNRGLEARPDKRPMMSDLRDSGAIEQDADIILFIYRDWVYQKKEAPDDAAKRSAEIIVAKHRNGGTGKVHVLFLGEYSRFVNPQTT